MIIPEKTISPGVAHLVSPELQEILWCLFEANPLLPSVFDLQKGRGRYRQKINHICLPFYDEYHSVEVAHPLHNIRISILITDTGTGLLMRLSNRNLEKELSQLPPGPEQGELF